MKNIVQVITKEAVNHLSNIAVIDRADKVTYAQLLKAVDQASVELKKRGVERFSRVALLSNDSIEYIIISLAVLSLYAVIVPVPFASTPDEINALLKDLRVNFLIFEQGSYLQKDAQPIVKKLFITKLKIKGKVP